MTYDLMIPLAVGIVLLGVAIGLRLYSMGGLVVVLTIGLLMMNYGVNGMVEDKAAERAQAVATAKDLRANNCRLVETDNARFFGPTSSFDCKGVIRTYGSDVTAAWLGGGAP